MEQIYDPVRKKLVKATPEEKVRQDIIRGLVEHCAVPITHIAVEYAFHYNKLLYRADVVVFDRTLQPCLMVECKAPSVALSEETCLQVARYNYVLDVPYILLTNGLHSYLCHRNGEGEYSVTNRMPSYEEMCQN